MSMDLRAFDLALQQFAEQTVPDRVRDVRDAVSLETHKGLVMMTPVDEGRARANWQVTAGTPATAYDEIFDESGGRTLSQGASTIAATKDPWLPIWIHNGVPYIRFLNDGTMHTRAVHMLEITVDRIRRMFRR